MSSSQKVRLSYNLRRNHYALTPFSLWLLYTSNVFLFPFTGPQNPKFKDSSKSYRTVQFPLLAWPFYSFSVMSILWILFTSKSSAYNKKRIYIFPKLLDLQGLGMLCCRSLFFRTRRESSLTRPLSA